MIQFAFLIATIMMQAPQATITYHVRMEQPATHYYNMQMDIANVMRDTVEVKMAVWTPGSYLVREYAKNIDAVKATDNAGNALQIKKKDKNTWIVLSNKKDFSVAYNVYAYEESVRTPFLDDRHATIIPAGVFLYAPHYDVPLTIHYYPATGWKKISTSLDMVNGDAWTRTAPNLDILFDSPVEIGNHLTANFTASGVEHEIAMYGEGNYDIEKLKTDFAKIVTAEEQIFGEHPCKKYVVFIQNSNSAGGGLEHLNSTTLFTRRFNYQPESNYRGFLGLFSHEYFHLWNVKRLRPAALGPFNYDTENYTTSLWIAEGFTAYYDDLVLRRAGLMNVSDYITVAEGNMNTVSNRGGDSIQPVADASFDAWIKYYRSNENSNNTQVDYYTKGAALAMALDLQILHSSKGKYRLDDVMKYMYNEYYKKLQRGYTEDEMKAAIEKFAGENMDAFYTDHVYGTKSLDYAKYFAYAGLQVTDVNTGNSEIDLGATISATNTITQLRRNSSAERAGLNVNDEIIAVDNYRFTNNLSTLLLGKKAGDTITVTVSRNGLIRNYPLILEYNKKVNYQLTINADATPEQKEVYKKWLSTDSFN